MDQEKIGKFIASCRKKKNLTQLELANKLYVTDRAVSKWETGKGVPDSSIMLNLCKELNISVNELLSGENIKNEDYKEKSEENLFKISKKEQECNKKLIICENVIGLICTLFFVTLILISVLTPISKTLKIILFIFAFLILILGVGFAVKIETEVGYYICNKCNHKYNPKYLSAFLAFHIGITRYLKCPKCKKFSWSKKNIK